MNIQRFNIKIHTILFGLLLSSGFPQLIYNSVFFESINPNFRFNLYVYSLIIREFFIFLLGLKVALILFGKINLRKIKYRALMAFLPLISILLLIIYDYNIVLLLTGLRFYALFALPLLVFEENSNLNFKKNIIINDYIFYLYLVLNILTFAIGFDQSSSAFFGRTFLGPRFIFIFSSPGVAAQTFGVFLIYTNFRITIEKSNFEKKKFLIISILLLFMTLYTGGRAGLVVACIAFTSSVIIYLFPKIKYIFLTQKKIENKFFTFSTLIILSIFVFFLSSNPLISGRSQTVIQNQRIFEGVFGNRMILLDQFLKNNKKEDIIFGKPGRGTNTACNSVTSDPNSKECSKTDSLPLSSMASFGIIGFLMYIVILLVLTNSSFSPLMPMAFFVYSLSQVFPELILPWIQFILILFHSNQKEKIYKLKKSKQ